MGRGSFTCVAQARTHERPLVTASPFLSRSGWDRILASCIARKSWTTVDLLLLWTISKRRPSPPVAREDYLFDSGPFETWSVDPGLKRHNGGAAVLRNGTRSRTMYVWNEPGNIGGKCDHGVGEDKAA